MDGFSNPGIERRVLDVTSDADVQNVVHDILENEGRIDIIVNNAGIHAVGMSFHLTWFSEYFFHAIQALWLMCPWTKSSERLIPTYFLCSV
jgi:NAD(P)-dependent dehydrogenase (short-subunit alcohol dehydrogenase family)